MGTTAILMTTDMETVVTGIMVIMVLSVAPVIGDEIDSGGRGTGHII